MSFWQGTLLSIFIFLRITPYSAAISNASLYAGSLPEFRYSKFPAKFQNAGYTVGIQLSDSQSGFHYADSLARVKFFDSLPGLPFVDSLTGSLPDGEEKEPEEQESRSIQSYYLLKPVKPGKPGFTGDRQHGETGEMVDPVRVQVVNQRSEPVIGIPVVFEVVNYPSGGGDYRIDRRMVTTDSAGMAVVNFRLGTARGEYQIIARIRSSDEENIQLFNLYARDQNWLLFLFAGIAGGLALFLLGMEVMSCGLLRLAGIRMRAVFGNLSGNRFGAMGLGTFVTMVTQSSNALYLMLLSFVNAKMMRLRQTPGLMLGAGIGTTLTAQVIAFQLTDFSLLFLAAGFAMRIFTPRGHFRNTGDALMGLGILFFGMHVMSEAIYPLRSFEPFLQVLVRLENPITGILAGTVLTALIGSSAAFVGIMIIFGMQGLISLEASIAVILGTSTGAAVNAIVACINKGREARMVAVTIMLLKIAGVLIFVWYIKPFASVIEDISPAAAEAGPDEMAVLAEVMPRQIANAHSVYNVIIALLILPFTGIVARAAERMMPGLKKDGNDKREIKANDKDKMEFKKTEDGKREIMADENNRGVPEKDDKENKKGKKRGFKEVNYLDVRILKTPVLALSLAKNETSRMGEIVHDMVSSVLPVFLDKDPIVLKYVDQQEKKVNFLSDRINAYLLKISRTGLSEARMNESFHIFYTLKEMGEIAAAVSASVHRKAGYRSASGHSFSEEERREIIFCHERTCKLINLALEVLKDVDMQKSLKIKQKYREQVDIARDFEKEHYQRCVQEAPDNVISSKTSLELMFMLGSISSHAVNIVWVLLQ